MAEFRIFINQRALLDLLLRGGEFKWSRNGVDAVASRLDRFLVSIDWEELFPESVQRRMARPFSYHFPICLESLLSARGKTPFRFENMWLQFEGFFDLIKEWWEETQPHAFASYVIASKLKYIKAKLKVWNREIFGDIRVKKKSSWKRSILLT